MNRIGLFLFLLLSTLCRISCMAYDYTLVMDGVYYKVTPDVLNEDKSVKTRGYAMVVAGEIEYSETVRIVDVVTVHDDVRDEDIEYPVTIIATKCFSNCKKLKEVILGNNITTIKSQAFNYSGDSSGNKNAAGNVVRNGVIINLDAPSLEVVEANAFYSTTVVPPDEVLRIGAKVRQLGDNNTTFLGWSTLCAKKIEIEEGNTSFELDVVMKDGVVDFEVLYSKNKEKLIYFPRLCTGKNYTTPATTKRVLTHSIYGSALASFTDGGALVYVGGCTFGCANITLGKNVTSIGEYYRLCDGANNKMTLTIDPENKTFKVIEDANHNRALYKIDGNGNPTILLKAFRCNGYKVNGGQYNENGYFGTETFILPTTVKEIASLAFLNCTYTKFVDCEGNTVLEAKNISDTAVPSPVSLKFINISLYNVIDGIEYTKDGKKLVTWGTDVNIPNYVMPDGVTSIAGAGMHSNGNTKTFDISAELKIGSNDGYFFNLYNLEKFTNSRGNTTLFVYDDALYHKADNGVISMVSYPKGTKSLSYPVADGTAYLSGTTGTPAVRTFDACNSLRAIDLGDDMIEMRYRSMRALTNLEVLKLASPQPPIASSGTFESTASASHKRVLCVPSNLMEIYKKNSVFNTCFYIIDDVENYDQHVKDVEVKYSVEHYIQNIDDDEYVSYGSTPNCVGKISTMTDAALYAYNTTTLKGFTFDHADNVELTEEGTVVNIYYNRNEYTVTWMNGDAKLSEATKRYQTPLVAPALETLPAGKNFVGWHTDPLSSVALNLDEATYVDDITYYALLADNPKKNYTVKHLFQTLDGTSYEEDESLRTTGEGIWGTTTAVSAQTVTGFTAQNVDQQEIKEDGTTEVVIKYDRNKYTVTWKNGDAELATAEHFFGTVLVAPPAPSAVAGKHFIGWNTTDGAQTTVAPASQYEDNTTYYAVFAANDAADYQVCHYLEGLDGSYAGPNATESGSGTAGLQTQAAAKQYTGFTLREPIEQVTIKEDGSSVVNIYYTRNSYSVKWMNGTSELASATLKYGASITAPEAPTAPAGKHYVGWNTDKNAQESMVVATSVAGDVTYYAIILDNATVDYTVKHLTENLDGTYSEKALAIGKGKYGLQTEATANTYEGFEAQSFDQETIAEDGSTIVEIKYSRNSYQLVYEEIQEATITNETTYTKSGSVKYEAPIELPVMTRVGYETPSWSMAVPTTMPAVDLTLTAVWSKKSFTVTWYFQDEAANYISAPIPYGDAIVKPSALPQKEGYDFIGWATSPTATEAIENDDYGIMTEAGAVFYAVFTPNVIDYQVVHSFENLDGVYEEDESLRETLTTTYNGQTNAVAKSVDGFEALAIVQKSVTSNDVTVEVKYQRKSFILTWVNTRSSATVTNEGSYTPTGTIKYGTSIVAPLYTLEGATYTWDGVVPPTMPNDDLTFTTVWEDDEPNAIEAVGAGVTRITAKGNNIEIEVPAKQMIAVYSITGQIIYQGVVENTAIIAVDAKGIYVVKTEQLVKRVLVK